ncbi:MAG: hypothetical protein KDB23_25900, partial [Planctomycetales bacterium]|nr:hypothetical protein [Planctomycetales bacterium]
LSYDPATGDLGLRTHGRTVTSLEILSRRGLFQGDTPDDLQTPFDVFSPTKFFLLKTAGIQDTDWGPILPPGLDAELLFSDLSMHGSIKGAGGLGTVGIEILPEPSALTLFALGLLPIFRHCRLRCIS